MVRFAMPQSKLSTSALPWEPDALYAAACVAWRQGRREEAIARLDQALRRRPDFAKALSMGGYMLSESGKPEAALHFYRRALSIDPSLGVAHVNLGKLLFEKRRFAEALAAFETATALTPGDADAWCCRAGALRELGRLEESREAAQRALALRPDFVEAAINLGNALLKLDRMDEALCAYRRASAARPGFAAALCGEALALRNLGRFDEALAAFEAAESLGSREAVAGKGCLLLTLGDFERGFEGYEARWLEGKSLAEALGTRFPTWRGPPRPGERILVLNDHGLGDTIQFFRYLPLMAAAGVEITFVCPPKLHRLLTSGAAVRLVGAPPAQETFDAQIAISSLPRAFGTRLDTIPADVPYLSPEAPVQRLWAERIGAAGFKIGLVWQGNPNPEADRARSIPLAALAPLADIAGVRLISLQKGYGEEQLAGLPPAMRVETLGSRFRLGLRRLRRYGGGDDAMRSHRHLRHVDRPSRRRSGAPGLGRSEERRRVAMAQRARRLPLVPDDASLPPVAARRMARCGRRHGARTPENAWPPGLAPDDHDPMFDRRTDRQNHNPSNQDAAY